MGESSDADRPTLEKAYVTLARKTHPYALRSLTPSEEDDVMEYFNTVTHAFRTLSDPLERKRYNIGLKARAFTIKAEEVIDLFSPILGKGVVWTNKGIAAMNDTQNGDMESKAKQMESVTLATGRIGGIHSMQRIVGRLHLPTNRKLYC